MSLITNNFTACNTSEPSSTSTFSFDSSSSVSSNEKPLFRRKDTSAIKSQKKNPHPSSTFSFNTNSSLSSSSIASTITGKKTKSSSHFSFDSSSVSTSSSTSNQKPVSEEENAEVRDILDTFTISSRMRSILVEERSISMEDLPTTKKHKS